jgi:hypothetical protein
MSLAAGDRERLAFLVRVVDGECRNLKSTDGRLFDEPFTPARASTLSEDAALAERVDAFVARFSRLQDTLGDKLLPVLLAAVGEDRRTLVDRLDQAERLGWIESSDEWMAIRKLRNQMVHEYIEDSEVLAGALQSGHQHVVMLLQTAERMLSEIKDRGWLAQ